MNGWQRFVGRKVKLVFDDFRTGSVKTGLVKEANEDYILLKTDYCDEEAIATSRIVRVELGEEKCSK